MATNIALGAVSGLLVLLGAWAMRHRIVAAMRALRGHIDPCKTCEARFREMQLWANEWEATFQEILEKDAARNARAAKRLKAITKALPQAVEDDGQANGRSSEPEFDPRNKDHVRQLARERGVFP